MEFLDLNSNSIKYAYSMTEKVDKYLVQFKKNGTVYTYDKKRVQLTPPVKDNIDTKNETKSADTQADAVIHHEREFDLNIEKILESWDTYHAIREIIANALDEQAITGTKDITIKKIEENWHIIDYGRGLNYRHLTQNENDEKLTNEKLIGRFGVGLKDALATLYRHGINVKIVSRHGVITLVKSGKTGFEDIVTLHAKISSTINKDMNGTDFVLEGCADEDIYKAKSLFLNFSGERIIEETLYGQVIEKGDHANIYINGVRVAVEPDFLFSYNITSLTKQLKKALNRERINVGRSAYTDRIKSILTACANNEVIDEMIDDSQKFGIGGKHDELTWNEVAMFTYKKLSERNSKAAFITTEDLLHSPSIMDEMKRDGYSPVVVPSNFSQKMNDYNQDSSDGNFFNTTNQFIISQNDDFQPTFIDVDQLSKSEYEVYNYTSQILDLIGEIPPTLINEIKIAEKIYDHEYLNITLGVWKKEEKQIIIKRSQLSSINTYAATLLHECAHAISGATDVSRDFEKELTKIIGRLVEKNLAKKRFEFFRK